jgi:hypothetical protein
VTNSFSKTFLLHVYISVYRDECAYSMHRTSMESVSQLGVVVGDKMEGQPSHLLPPHEPLKIQN